MSSSTHHRLLLLLSTLCNLHHLTTACYSTIFSFGDSYADTGNLFQIKGKDHLSIGRPPYGETYFGQPSGRFSDGRIVIDFIADAMGLPFLQPYLAGQGGDEFRSGVNFAVGGVTAIENSFFKSQGIVVPWTNISLGTQMQWFKQVLPSLCSNSSDCRDLFKKSLFMVGEIGQNDYDYFFFQERKLEEVESLVPRVVGSISSAVQELIMIGARSLVIPGIFPLGCSSILLTQYQSKDAEIYDPQTGCINWLNGFAMLHNNRLQQEILDLQKLHPETTIIYADYYGAAMEFITNPREFGFGEQVVSACCGGGGPYNYNSSLKCGRKGSFLCADPSKYIVWDGLHLTEAAYSVVASGLLRGPHASIPIFHTCPLNPKRESI